MSGEKPVYLLAGKDASRDRIVGCCREVLQSCGKEAPAVVYIGTASGDDRAFFMMVRMMLLKAGAGSVVMPKLATGKADVGAAKKLLDSCDAVFITGGEVEDGMYWLKKHGLDEYLQKLYREGKLFFGMSAGSIMMGKSWVRWDVPGNDTTAKQFDCLGLVPAVFDAHAEDEDWVELKTLLRLMGPGSEGRGLSTGCMLRMDSTGSFEDLRVKSLLFRNEDGIIRRKS